MMAVDSKICQYKSLKKKGGFLADCIDAGGGCISVRIADDFSIFMYPVILFYATIYFDTHFGKH